MELENSRNIARQLADWLSLTAISTFTQSKVVFEGSLAAELKLSETSARSFPEGQAYAFTQSGYTHKNIHMQLWNQNRSKKLPKKAFTFPR